MLVNTLLPLLALWWLMVPSRADRAEWLTKVLVVASYLFCVTFASVWLVPSVFAPYAYFALFVVALILSWLVMRRRPWAPATRGTRLRSGGYVALAAVFVAVGVYGILGRSPPTGTPVALAFPLPPGTYYVASGGSNRLVNFHLDAPARFRGQEYAVDIVAVDRLGQRSSGLLPVDPAAYTIFGKLVKSPCDGTIVRVIDGLPDQSPPQADRSNPTGNHVLIECGAAQVLLAHLRNGSVTVKPGDPVRRGDPIGAVGNSGNSGEPHLHVHAQKIAAGGADLLDREPLPITLGGRLPVRGIFEID